MSVDDKLQELRDAAVKAIGDNEAAQSAVRNVFTAYDAALESAREDDGGVYDDFDDEDSREREAIDAFLDVVERPVGKLTFTVPQTPEADRAILGLHDVIGRGL